ncbi:MAG: translation initiation factor IF-2 [Candidatus Paceibacterota bacterium]
MAKEKIVKTKAAETAERPPVVVVMGHIDHGKSALLDFIRQTNVVAGEAGSITQHLSAYEVALDRENKTKKITFLDTPGHAAFTNMRELGSLIADIAILVVSAEEGVKTQTLEALGSIKNAGIPYIVAINKIDRPNANIEKTKQDLAENNILIESYGGKIPAVNISAKTGAGIDELLDMILLVSELEELAGGRPIAATGFVLEAGRDPKTGTAVTLIIKDGTLHTGDFVVIGRQLAKVKRLEDFLGQTIKEASFSSPVRVFGFTETPAGGEVFITFHHKKEAENYLKEIGQPATEKIDDEIKASDDKVIIPLVLKADTLGTLEAVQREIAKQNLDNIRLKTVQSGIGALNENDIRILTGSNGALALGFNVKVDATATDIAERFDITVQTFDIIYKLSEWLAEEMERRRPRIETEISTGKIKILKLFSSTKNKFILGGKVIEGKISKADRGKIWRRELIIGQGKIAGLQVNKLEVTEVEAGNECGLLLETKSAIAPGDVLETFIIESK